MEDVFHDDISILRIIPRFSSGGKHKSKIEISELLINETAAGIDFSTFPLNWINFFFFSRTISNSQTSS